MTTIKIFICGTRKKGYANDVKRWLQSHLSYRKSIGQTLEIIHGDCPDSADSYAQEWADENNIKTHKYPGTQRTYLKRNIEMAKDCDFCVAFWDGFSYGTAHSIAHVTKLNKRAAVFPFSNREGDK